jgi:hypothetical protein
MAHASQAWLYSSLVSLESMGKALPETTGAGEKGLPPIDKILAA